MSFPRAPSNSGPLQFLSILFVALFFSTSISISHAEKILFFNGFASHSHLVAFEPLAKKLADMGHNVTILSTQFSEVKHPKINHYCPKSVLEMQDEMLTMGKDVLLKRLESKYNDYFMQTAAIWDDMTTVCDLFYSNPEFREWMQKDGPFDLVITDTFSRECSLPLAHIWKAKSILFSPASLIYPEGDTFGFSPESSWHMPWESEAQSGWPEDLRYEYMSIKWYLWRQWNYLPAFDRLVKSSFPHENVPKLSELEKNVDLCFANVHYSYEFAKSLPPFVVPVGGMHCKDGKRIADEKIRNFVEDPESDGFIYISYGSIVQISALPSEYLKIYFDTMKTFPKIRFLWKWEGDFPKDVPKNVLMSKWFKQQDVLGHPKCKGFISQGGLMSFQQAVYHGVPLIVMPGGADQVINARVAAKLGMGIHFEFSEITPHRFKTVIGDLIENPKYMGKVKHLSKLSKDRPMSALETAVWWTEYVLRHDDLSHLKTPGIHQTWWQRRLLHLWAFVFITLLILTSLLLTLLYIACTCFCRASTKRPVEKSTNKKNK